jgi:hypothetical protein
MAFSGLSTAKEFVVNGIQEDVANTLVQLFPYESPFLDWIGDPSSFATSTKHEFWEDFMRPRTIIASTASPRRPRPPASRSTASRRR